MNLSEELAWRGLVHQTTFKSITELDNAPLNLFLGADPSADSLTIGNLAALMLVRRFVAHGHNATLLVGGATGLIGDPDGKKQERDLKSIEEIEKNIQAITAQYALVLPENSFEVVNNNDWFKDITYMDFLRDIGKHMSMTQLLDRDFVKKRIGEGGTGISYAEFSYSLIQGYDFLHLYRKKNITLQLCGADQWGNSLSGVEMIRKLEGATAHVYSVPLIVNKSTGVKFGKSEAGAVWLDEKKTSVYQFYQFWLNLDDEGVGDYLKVYTDIAPDEFESLMERFQKQPHAREAQLYLADYVTALIHGDERLQSVKRVTKALFGGAEFSTLSDQDVQMLAREIPTARKGLVLTDTLVDSGVVQGKGEARRLLSSGAVSVNGVKVSEDTVIDTASLIKKGKNTFVLVIS